MPTESQAAKIEVTHAVQLARHLADLYMRRRFTDLKVIALRSSVDIAVDFDKALAARTGALRWQAVRDARERSDVWQRLLPCDARAPDGGERVACI